MPCKADKRGGLIRVIHPYHRGWSVDSEHGGGGSDPPEKMITDGGRRDQPCRSTVVIVIITDGPTPP